MLVRVCECQLTLFRVLSPSCAGGAVIVSRPFSVSCRCTPARLLLLEDEEDDGTRLLPSEAHNEPPQLRSFHRSAAVLRPRLGVLNSLLQLARNLTPSVRGSFVESVIEHDCIDSLTRVLHSLSRIAHLDASLPVRRMCEWLLPAALCMLAALLSSCPDSFRSYVVESHALHSPSHSSASATVPTPSLSLIDSLLTALCNPSCAGSSGGGAIVSFLRSLCDGDEDDSSGEHVQQLQRLCIEGAGMAVLGDSLARFSAHPRPAFVRRSAVCAVEWLIFAAGKFKAVAVSRFALMQHLLETCKTFLTRTSPQPPASTSSDCPLLAAPNDVVCGVLRLLSCLIRCHRPPLIDALIEVNVLDAVLRSVLSPAYLLLHSTSLLTSAALELFNQLTPVTHMPAVRRHVLVMQPHMQHIAHVHVVSQMMQRCHAYHKQHTQQQHEQQQHGGGQSDSSHHNNHHHNNRADRGRRKRKAKSAEEESGDSKRSRRQHQHQPQQQPPPQDRALHTGDTHSAVDRDSYKCSVRDEAADRSSVVSGRAGECEVAASAFGSSLTAAATSVHSSALLVSPDYYEEEDAPVAVGSPNTALFEDDERLDESGAPQQQPHTAPQQAQLHSALSPSVSPAAYGDSFHTSVDEPPLSPPAAHSASSVTADSDFDSWSARLVRDRRQQREAEEERADLLANISKRARAQSNNTSAHPQQHPQQQQQQRAANQTAYLATTRSAISISFKRPSMSFALNGVWSPHTHNSTASTEQTQQVPAESGDAVDSTAASFHSRDSASLLSEWRAITELG